MPKKITESAIQEQLNILEQTVPRITKCTDTLGESFLQTASTAGEWSANEILTHIRSCAEVWSYSIYAMLIIDAPELNNIHPNTWSKFQQYNTLSFAENLLAFDIQRQNLLRKLKHLSLKDWKRTGRFSNKSNEYSVFSQTRRMAQHELGHCEQIESIIKAQN